MTPEQFELLSVYLDQEASPEERQQVEQWLSIDPHFRAVYQQQLRLRQALIALPTPPVDTSYVMAQVLDRIERRSRWRWLWGSVGAACLAAASVAGTLLIPPSSYSLRPELSQLKTPVTEEEPLKLAMERPIVPMPKAIPSMVREAP
ncbi:MAG: Fis family transcriptional regulator [Oscillatoriales cyanobacterium SM2_2_1]|nr:Fis family transcriptional regulator [Oscillatoriales cyanobacterium SM2_2_1]